MSWKSQLISACFGVWRLEKEKHLARDANRSIRDGSNSLPAKALHVF
jgi:hypothetical protein